VREQQESGRMQRHRERMEDNGLNRKSRESVAKAKAFVDSKLEAKKFEVFMVQSELQRIESALRLAQGQANTESDSLQMRVSPQTQSRITELQSEWNKAKSNFSRVMNELTQLRAIQGQYLQNPLATDQPAPPPDTSVQEVPLPGAQGDRPLPPQQRGRKQQYIIGIPE
jgi:Tfp pilus assembly protein FimV